MMEGMVEGLNNFIGNVFVRDKSPAEGDNRGVDLVVPLLEIGLIAASFENLEIAGDDSGSGAADRERLHMIE